MRWPRKWRQLWQGFGARAAGLDSEVAEKNGGDVGAKGRGIEKQAFVSPTGGPGEDKGTRPTRPCMSVSTQTQPKFDRE